MLLTRTSDGRLLNDGQQIVLRGAHCHLFSEVGGDRALLRGGQDFLIPFPVAGAPGNWCTSEIQESNLSISNWGSYTAFLDRLRAAECNLTRVFLSNGVEQIRELDPPGIRITTLHPFAREGNKWRVAAAIRDRRADAWSADYFQRLTAFVRAADQRGIAVQLCLFSYHDFLPTTGPFFRYWPASFWNAANADDRNWADLHLLPPDGAPPHLNRAFMNVANANLLQVQQAYVERILSAVAGSGNVILELMNEPRIARAEDTNIPPNGQAIMAAWLDRVTGWIVDALPRLGVSPRPLISANASYPVNGVLPATPAGTPASDVDGWAAQAGSLTRYRELDLVSYHGLTGVASAAAECRPAPQVDLPAIQARIARHKSAHASKALMLSTDAVRIGPLTLKQPNGVELAAERRDGHLRTNIGYQESLAPNLQRSRFDLDNWAFSTLREGVKPAELGRVHFQNHSTYERSFAAIRDAWRAASGTGGPGGGAWQGPYVRVTGGANHQNFWWAHRQNSANGELVNQFHTENGAGSAAAATGESEIGWRFDLTGSGGSVRLTAAYDLVSASEIEDPQATVEQRLRLWVSPLVGGQPGPNPVGVAERVVQRGQSGPGSLELQVSLAAGQAYRVTAATRVAIVYQNKTKVGYGETIVRFSSLAVS